MEVEDKCMLVSVRPGLTVTILNPAKYEGLTGVIVRIITGEDGELDSFDIRLETGKLEEFYLEQLSFI